MSGISVVIPCYRCTRTVGRAVASAASQTLAPLEIILVDDASADDTGQKLVELRALHGEALVKIISLVGNRGAGEARNAGWDAARGEYVAFLDADDAWHPRKLELQHRFMAEHPQVGLCGHAHSIQPDENAPAQAVQDGYEMVPARALLLKNRFVTPSVMVRRDVTLRFPEGKRYMEDHYLWTRMAYEGLGVARLNAALATTFKHTFADAGLASHLVGMELGELDNYRRLLKEGRIGPACWAAMSLLSAARFARRCLITLARR
jgi:glycosyltransferase involved in cell wall biosynthesis